MWIALSLVGLAVVAAAVFRLRFYEGWTQFRIQLCMVSGRTDRALPLLQGQLSRLERSQGAGRLDTEVARYTLGQIEFENGLPDQGRTRVNEAAAFFSTYQGVRDRDFTVHLMNLAIAQRAAQQHDAAVATLRQVVAAQKALLPENDPQIGLTLCNLGAVLEESGQPADALPVFEEALKVRVAAHGEESTEVAKVRLNQAAALLRLENWGEAERCLRAALPVFQKDVSARDATGQAYDSYAELFEAQGRLDEAEPMRDASLNALRQALGERHPEVAKQHERQASLLGRLGRAMERDLHARKAKEIREALRCSVSPSL